MLVKYVCTECGWDSDIRPTVLTHNAVVSLGYKDSCEFFEKALKPKLATTSDGDRKDDQEIPRVS